MKLLYKFAFTGETEDESEKLVHNDGNGEKGRETEMEQNYGFRDKHRNKIDW